MSMYMCDQLFTAKEVDSYFLPSAILSAVLSLKDSIFQWKFLINCKMEYVYILYMYMCCVALLVCLTLLASFFLPSHLSFNVHASTCTCIHMYSRLFNTECAGELTPIFLSWSSFFSLRISSYLSSNLSTVGHRVLVQTTLYTVHHYRYTLGMTVDMYTVLALCSIGLLYSPRPLKAMLKYT